ncbi:hypothetical protein C4556_03895 [Candidatus Parcubacteria bacterium]|nr:MAG: hypothetical protein C4556_03895 [Candidatus Parcubacteria bacterium]
MLTFIGAASVVAFIGLMFWTDDSVLGRRLSRALERERRKKKYGEIIAQDEARIECVVEGIRAMIPQSQRAFLEAAE